MKNLLGAILLFLLAVAMPWYLSLEYARVADLRDNGKQGSLSVLAETRGSQSYRSRGKRIWYAYDGSLAGVPVRFTTRHYMRAGDQHPVLFSAEKLREYASPSKGGASAAKIGAKAESKREVILRNFGTLLRAVFSPNKSRFDAYAIGWKSDSKWELFVSNFGGIELCGLAVLEAVAIFLAWVLWNSFKNPDPRWIMKKKR